MKRWEQLINKSSFFQGIVFAAVMSSVITFAATNLPGFFVFQAGTPISAEEMNSNFEKVAGKIVLQGTISADKVFSFDSSTTCSGISYGDNDCRFAEKLKLDSLTITDSNVKTATNSDTTEYTSTGDYTYYEIAESGWYELRVRGDADLSGVTMSCDSANGSTSVSMNIQMQVVTMQAGEPSNEQGSSVGSYASIYKNDNDGDGTFDSNYFDGMIGRSERRYLKVGSAVIFTVSSGINFNSASIVGDTKLIASDVEFQLIKL